MWDKNLYPYSIKIMASKKGKGKNKMAIAKEHLKEQERLARIRKMAAPIHARTKAAGITERELRVAVKKALKDMYGRS